MLRAEIFHYLHLKLSVSIVTFTSNSGKISWYTQGVYHLPIETNDDLSFPLFQFNLNHSNSCIQTQLRLCVRYSSLLTTCHYWAIVCLYLGFFSSSSCSHWHTLWFIQFPFKNLSLKPISQEYYVGRQWYIRFFHHELNWTLYLTLRDPTVFIRLMLFQPFWHFTGFSV